MENETRIQPIWKEVALEIVGRIESEGYGFMIDHKELFKLLEIEDPTTIAEAMRQRLDILKKVEELRSCLLYDHNVLLFNEFNKGYVVLNPDEQVTKGYERQFDKARKKIHKAIDVLNYVNHELLSQSGVEQRDRNLGKAVFVLSAFNKRRIPDMKRKAIA
jgi:hypothetical protein